MKKSENKKTTNGSDSKNQLPLFSFYSGLKQLSIPINFQFIVPDCFNFVRISKELQARFDVEDAPINTLVSRQLSNDEDVAQHFIWLAMLLATSLLQALKIPCISVGMINDIKIVDKKKRCFQVACRFPAVENHSSALINACLGHACRLIKCFSNPTLTETEISALLDELHEKFIVTTKKRVPGGESTIPILKSAFKLDIPFMHIGNGVYQLGWGALRRFSHRSTTELDSAIGSKISQNKVVTAEFLRLAGLPAPFHFFVTTLNQAQEAANKIGFPVVIKPADRDRGEGVTVGINNAESLNHAFNHASKFSKNILVERQVPGICHRILLADNTHLYTVARLAKSVAGDGKHTFIELCMNETAEENRKAKHLRKKPCLLDALTEKTLRQQGLNYQSIPQEGVLVFLRPIESTEWGGTPKLLIDQIHPENLRIAFQAAQLMNLNVAGVDLITEDISKPWYENGAVINEVNFAPFLGLHFDYQRQGVEALVQSLFREGGRIPIEVYIGDEEALKKARHRQQELALENQQSFLTTHLQTFNVSNEIRFALPSGGLFNRCRMLLMNKVVESLVIVIQTDELLSTGLPIDSINAITLVNQYLVSNKSLNQPARSNSAEMILELLKPYYKKGIKDT
jgi:cyanophycin synthetase